MLKSDIDPAKAAAQYLDNTAKYNSADVTSFVVTARLQGTNLALKVPPVSIIIDSSAPAFATLLTAFSNKVSAQRTAAQNVLTNLGITG